jgi:hypothetical protein
MQRLGVVLSTGDLRGVFAHTGFLLAPQVSPIHRLEPERGPHLIRQGYEETLRLLPPLIKKLSDRSTHSGEEK